MGTTAEVLDRLQGVWFPTHLTVDGRLCWTHEPVFPAGREPWLMTVVRDTAHVTSMHEYYATGGWLRVLPASGRLTLVYPQLPEEYHSRFAYRLSGDELLLCSGGFPWSSRHDTSSETRYVRVASEPTPEMAALISKAVHGWDPWPAHAGPGAAPDPAA